MSLLNLIFLFSQIAAGLAFLCGVVSYQFQERRVVMRCWSACAFIYSLHFALLGQTTPAIITFITGSRFLLAQRTSHRAVFLFFLTATLAAGYLTYQEPINLLPTFAGLAGTSAVFLASNFGMRLVFAGCSLIWIVHNYFIGSPMGVLMEFVFLISNAAGFYRLRKRWHLIKQVHQ